LEGNYERNLNEEIALRQRIVTSTGALSPQRAEFYQQGAVGIDLTGNVIIDMEVDVVRDSIPFRTYSFADLFQSSGGPNAAGNVRPRLQQIIYPEKAVPPIMMRASLEYAVRHVASGDKSIAEGDDRVQYLRGRSDGGVSSILIPAEEMRFVLWGLAASDNFIQIREPGARGAVVLALSSYEQAEELLSWLQKTAVTRKTGEPLSVGARDLLLGSRPLERSMVGQLARIIHEGQGLRSADVREGGAWGAIGGVG
jgi:hypothetical protein